MANSFDYLDNRSFENPTGWNLEFAAIVLFSQWQLPMTIPRFAAFAQFQ